MLLRRENIDVDNVKIKATLSGFAAILLWALAPSLVKLQSAGLPALYFLVVRYGISSLLFVPTLLRISPARIHRSLSAWLGLAACLVLHLGFQVLALGTVPVSWYVVFFSFSPILSLIVLRTRWNGLVLFGFGFAVVGSILFVANTDLKNFSASGFAFLVTSVSAWAVLALAIRRIQTNLNDLEVTGACNMVSLFAFTVLWLANGAPHVPLNNFDWVIVISLSFTMPAAFFLFSYALRHVPVVALFGQFLEPLFGIFFGALFFREHVIPLQIFGAVIILLASYMVMSSRAPESSVGVSP